MQAARPTHRRTTIAILAFALGLRLLVLRSVLHSYPPGWLFTHGQEMGLLAKSLLAGQGLSSPFGVPTGPTAFIAPGYPLLIAGIFRVFGIETVASVAAIISLQIVANLITIWLMMRIARALFGQSAATVAGLIWACSLPIVWLPTIFWDTSLAICLLTAIFAFALEFRALMTSRKWIGLGSACAITALINPAMLPALGAIVVWLVFQQPAHRVRALVLSAVTGILVFSPWPIRNAVVFHALIPLRTTVGMELWMGNRDGAKGFVDESVFPTFNKQELHDYETMGELAYTAHKSDLARNYIATHPAAFLRLTSVRIARFWFGTGSENGSPLFALHAILTTCFGFVGLGLLVREKRVAIATLFALPLLLFPFPYYITHAEFRYRLALDTLLSILAAHALVTIYRRLDGRSKPAPADTPGALREVHG